MRPGLRSDDVGQGGAVCAAVRAFVSIWRRVCPMRVMAGAPVEITVGHEDSANAHGFYAKPSQT